MVLEHIGLKCMKWRKVSFVVFFIVLVLTALAGCQHSGQVSGNWQKKERQSLLDYAASFNPGSRDLDLSVSQVVSMDDKTFLLGGSYRSPAASVRSALLRSTDRGKTWVDTGVWMTGCNTWKIFVLDKKHAFAVVNWSIEGWLGPFVFFRTSDGGVSWQRSKNDLPFSDDMGVPVNAGLSFVSPSDGHFWVTGATGKSEYYITADGSRTWKLAHVVKNEQPDSETPNCKHKKDWKNKKVRIQYFKLGEPHYETICVISTEYSIDKRGNITPKPVSSE